MHIEEVHEILKNAMVFPKKANLTKMRSLLVRIGSPEKRLKFVHIAGTNGKGSTAALTAAALSAQGYKTGLFTSPYVETFNERIMINAEPVSDETLARAMQVIYPHVVELSSTFFEIVTALAFLLFDEQKCDIVVLETGLGGRLDQTNCIEAPLVCAITRVGLDHTAQLGNTITKIAAEKAGIIKEGSHVVLLKQSAEVMDVVINKASEQCTRLTICPPPALHLSDGKLSSSITYTLHNGRVVLHTGGEVYPLSLSGAYQAENGAMAMAILDALAKRGFPVSHENMRDGFINLKWPGRFVCIPSNNMQLIVDGAHNPIGVHALIASLVVAYPSVMREKRAVFVCGMMGDKDITSCLIPLLPYAMRVYTIPIDGDARAIDAESLCIVAESAGLNAVACTSLREGIYLASRAAKDGGLVCIFGSLHQCNAAIEACRTLV